MQPSAPLCDVCECERSSGRLRPPVSILVRPDALEAFAVALNVARVPLQLSAQHGERKDVFRPLAPRRGAVAVGTLSGDERQADRRSHVFLHVYDTEVARVESSFIKSIAGLSIYHVGVEVNRQEYCFSSDGILVGLPGKFDPRRHRLVVPLGNTGLSNRDVVDALQGLHKAFRAENYRLVGFNCQTFAVEFCKQLGLPSDCVPREYRRFAEGLMEFVRDEMDPGFDENDFVAECYLPDARGGSIRIAAGHTPDRIRL
mmetsp:Transcript_30516/g.87149  ORF Transcript_30516/g.87149 Transcript_30516/m.87149 type:complete len:258 (-) Transcript_30516:181-954(-)